MGKGNDRAPWHDYRSKAKYMITMLKMTTTPCFGEPTKFMPSTELHNPYDTPILLSHVGCHVRDALRNLRVVCNSIRLWQYVIMPDHVHFLINVVEELEEPIGNYIARLKIDANNRCGLQIFQAGFNDQIITPQRSLDEIFHYIKTNPYRLAVRFAYPEYFRRVNRINIAGQLCQAYGNLHLLENPFKMQVVCHRADTEVIKKRNKEKWFYNVANGGVLVSPFISGEEKKIRTSAEELEGKLILISNRLMGEREKPVRHDFELCEQGRLLIIIPYGLPADLNRQACMEMNAFAAKLATAPAGRNSS